MIKTVAVILVLITKSHGGVAMQEFANYESCKSALSKVEDALHRSKILGYCVAKDVTK